MSNNIEGKIVPITGASSGLGEATAKLLLAQGVTVVHGARRLDRIESLSPDLSAWGGEVLAVGADVTDFEQVGKHRPFSDDRYVPVGISEQERLYLAQEGTDESGHEEPGVLTQR